MITIISGTNRPGSTTLAYAKEVLATSLAKTNEKVEFIDLAELDHSFIGPGMYDPAQAPSSFVEMYDAKLRPAKKLIILSPEYNGSYAGILKAFIDVVSVRNYKENFAAKPILLIGIASGRAGNLRGLDHLSAILTHMGGHVIGGKLPISNATNMLNEAGEVADEATKEALGKQIDHLISL